jgi:nucleoid-associated protein YgaU
MTAMDLTQLAKAAIINTNTRERIQVMYNPEQFSLEQGNNFAEVGIPGLDAPPIQYVRGKGRTLSMELFFDTYEQGADVRQFTDQIVSLLAKRPDTLAPPVLLFVMGQFTFNCVLMEAGQRFTMFSRDGTPVRSTLSVRFHEYVEAQVTVQSGVFIGPPTVRNVIEGETVSSIASSVLGDPSRWREIADANNLEDPFKLPSGSQLIIPGKTKQ